MLPQFFVNSCEMKRSDLLFVYAIYALHVAMRSDPSYFNCTFPLQAKHDNSNKLVILNINLSVLSIQNLEFKPRLEYIFLFPLMNLALISSVYFYECVLKFNKHNT